MLMPIQLPRRTSTRGERALAPSRPPAWSRQGVVVVVACLAAACGRGGAREPLAPIRLTAPQSQALGKMNEAGRTALHGRSWSYEFGAGCVLRIRRFHESREEPHADFNIAGGRIDVVPYANGGFGVKAYAKGTGADLFDSASEAAATTFAAQTRTLSSACASASHRTP
jgi:hypothetical protein